MLKAKSRLFLIFILSLITLYAVAKQVNGTYSSSEQANPTNASIMDRIKSHNELRVGTLHSLTPYYIDHNADASTPSGLDYELARLFADYLGVQIKVVQCNNLHELFDALENNEIDVIADGLVYLPERLSRFRTGPAYYTVTQQLIYQQGKMKPESINHLNGKLTVTALSAQSSLLAQLRDKSYPNLHWQESRTLTTEDLLKQIALGELDYTVADSATVSILQRIYPQLAVATDLTGKQPVNWYLNRSQDTSLYDEVMNFFEQAENDGSIARLEEKYLGHMGDFDYVDTKSFLAAIEKRLPKYRDLFEKYAETQGIDWQMLAAIAYQESHWNPHAVSPTGVRGIMMLTQSTAKSLGVDDRTDPEQSIRGGANYIQQLVDKIPDSVPQEDRIWYALAAYNMGFAHMLDARSLTSRQGGDPDSWLDVKKRLPMLSQVRYYSQTKYGYARGYQAYDYVENIRRYRMSLAGYLYEKDYQAEELAKRQQQGADNQTSEFGSDLTNSRINFSNEHRGY